LSSDIRTRPTETICIQEVLEKAVSPDMTKHILKARTQMVESMCIYFDAVLSESSQVRHNTHLCTACM
jgi:hypothetical protein